MKRNDILKLNLLQFEKKTLNNLHHFIVSDDFDGTVSVTSSSILNSYYITEHTLTGKTVHSIPLVHNFTNSNPYKETCKVSISCKLVRTITSSSRSEVSCVKHEVWGINTKLFLYISTLLYSKDYTLGRLSDVRQESSSK